MIKAVIYDKVANTQIGQMGGEMRVVGFRYLLPTSDEPLMLETIMEDRRNDQRIIVLSYSNDFQQLIPDRGVEKILKIE